MSETQRATLEAREAKHGQKMIEVKVRFWTDDVADEPGTILPGHAWTSGVVRISKNPAHGIVPRVSVPFNSLLEIGGALEEVLIKHGVKLHPGRRDKQYLSDKASAKWKKNKKIKTP